eukprot:scaffold26705_cov15-Prasinocladus_malaysianus.AAC.1
MHQVTDWLHYEGILAAFADDFYVLCTLTQRDVIMLALSCPPRNSSASNLLDGTGLCINPGNCTWLPPLLIRLRNSN